MNLEAGINAKEMSLIPWIWSLWNINSIPNPLAFTKKLEYKEPLLSLNEAFAIVRREEERRNLMLEKGSTRNGSALAISKPSGN